MTAGSRCTLRFVSAIAVFLAAGELATAAAASSGGQQFAQAAFPPDQFGNLVKAAMQVVAASETPAGRRIPGTGVAVIRLTLNGFDTHHDQPARQENLLKQFSEGMAALRSALIAMNRWNSTLVMTYAEFGRRARENGSRGTDHGTVAPHFMAGGAVRGGLYGAAPALDRLDGNGNPPVGVDFRALYATVLDRW